LAIELGVIVIPLAASIPISVISTLRDRFEIDEIRTLFAIILVLGLVNTSNFVVLECVLL